jgi:uncharacterized protein YdeI (YjbR/CyaY-like superfamily)
MSVYNKAVDDFIAKKAESLQPILHHFREIVHKVCIDAEEKIKWGMPFFDYKGEMMCHMAGFKNHAAIGFWKGSLMSDKTLHANADSEISMGHLGKICSLKDLPSDKKLTAYIREAMKLNDDGIKLIKKPAAEKTIPEVPDYFTKALAKNKKAKLVFEAFSPSCKKEYLLWITEAKTEATKEKRMAQALEMMEEGKSRNWKYK